MTGHHCGGGWCRAAVIATVVAGVPLAVRGQGSAAAPAHPRVCAAGIREYASRQEIPVPFDSLQMPPGEQIRVTSMEEAEAAQRTMRERAGSVGATGLLSEEDREDDGSGMVRIQRRVLPVFVPSDTARAYAACRTGAEPHG